MGSLDEVTSSTHMPHFVMNQQFNLQLLAIFECAILWRQVLLVYSRPLPKKKNRTERLSPSFLEEWTAVHRLYYIIQLRAARKIAGIGSIQIRAEFCIGKQTNYSQWLVPPSRVQKEGKSTIKTLLWVHLLGKVRYTSKGYFIVAIFLKDDTDPHLAVFSFYSHQICGWTTFALNLRIPVATRAALESFTGELQSVSAENTPSSLSVSTLCFRRGEYRMEKEFVVGLRWTL